jgi:3-hydroxyacyl-CoA dehydrogenase
LFDAVCNAGADGDLEAAARTFAGKAAGKDGPYPKVRDLPLKLGSFDGGPDAFFGFARNTVRAAAGPFPAPMNCLEAVAASVYSSSFDEGLAAERRLFEVLINTTESKALRHAFFGERAAAKIEDVAADTPTRPIEKAAVIGAGTMGGGIAMNFLNAGIPVTVLEMKQEALDKGLDTIRKNYERSLKKGRLTEAQLEDRMNRITPTLDYADVADADLVIEAVFEDLDVKRQVFEKLDEVMKKGAILATNTSTLDVDKIADFTKRPQDVVGTHFFSPANVMRLLEVVRGDKTAKDVLATVMKLAKTIRKVAVVAGVCDGFIGNRMIHKYVGEAMILLREGASPERVDRALEKWGMAMGPFRMGDLAGNDVGWYIRKRQYAENPDMPRQVIADRLCELGRFGQKTGKGWYAYEDGRTPKPDPEVAKLIEEYREEEGIEPREIPDKEIVERLIFALVNEGARILAEGIAQRASDVDMVYLNGYGFPLQRGGPMLYADTVGLFNVVRRMRAFAENPHTDGDFWRPAPLLVKLVGEGKTLTGSV